MSIGFSIYLGTSISKNNEVIQKAKDAKMKYAFTSLHIPEEEVPDYRYNIRQLLSKCNEKIKLIADVSPHTLQKLGCADYDELLKLGVNYIRTDFGYTDVEIVELSQKFHLVFNGSTMNVTDVRKWEKLGADLTKCIACHNFYPKPLTGISLKKVREMNLLFKSLGMMTMTFVSGNLDFREPLFLGLPTVEKHRTGDVFLNMLELFDVGASDVVLIGDIDVTEDIWRRIKAYNEGYISLQCDIISGYEFVKDILHHDRPDSSAYVIRSQESRHYSHRICEGDVIERSIGSVCMSNETYLRYEGELEIAKVDLDADSRINVIGRVKAADRKYLQYIKEGMGFKLV